MAQVPPDAAAAAAQQGDSHPGCGPARFMAAVPEVSWAGAGGEGWLGGWGAPAGLATGPAGRLLAQSCAQRPTAQGLCRGAQHACPHQLGWAVAAGSPSAGSAPAAPAGALP
jgi:hypothetical protein